MEVGFLLIKFKIQNSKSKISVSRLPSFICDLWFVVSTYAEKASVDKCGLWFVVCGFHLRWKSSGGQVWFVVCDLWFVVSTYAEKAPVDKCDLWFVIELIVNC